MLAEGVCNAIFAMEISILDIIVVQFKRAFFYVAEDVVLEKNSTSQLFYPAGIF